MKTAPSDPDYTPRPVSFTGGNVMVSGSILVLAISLAISAVTLKNSFERRMESIEWKLDAMSRDKWTLSRQREAHSTFWRDNPSMKMESSQPDVIAQRIP